VAIELEAKVLTVSDGVAEGVREDRSGDAVVDLLDSAGFKLADRQVVADGVGPVADALEAMCAGFVGLVVTTGGTGFGPRDLTPEATSAVIERKAPGLAETMRRVSDKDGRGFGMLSRGVAGTLGSALVVNLPGSSTGAVECLDAVLSIVPHALDLLAGEHPH
jgi:molybdenum cofactor synthesis domain-containing protein